MAGVFAAALIKSAALNIATHLSARDADRTITRSVGRGAMLRCSVVPPQHLVPGQPSPTTGFDCRSDNHAAGSIRQNPAIPDTGKGEWLAPVKGTVAKPNGEMVFSSPGPAARMYLPVREEDKRKAELCLQLGLGHNSESVEHLSDVH
jgi:hypothetical protein